MFKKYKVKDTNVDIEPHEVFLDKLAHAREEVLGISEKKLEVPLKEKTSYILFGVFLFLATILFSKIFYFQAIEGKKMYVAAENNKGSAMLIIPDRGIIYDKNFKKLVSNFPAFDLVCEKTKLSFLSEESLNKINNMAQALGISSSDINNKIQNSDSSEVLIAEGLTHENLLAVEARINEFDGCKIQRNTIRNYIYGPAFSHVLGYIGRINKDEYSSSIDYTINDYIGKMGIEKYYETYLRGKPGKMKVIRSATGKKQGLEILSDSEAGNNLILNIDADLQLKIYESLEKSIKNIGAKRGAAVAIDPRNGAILGLVSYPSYDNNLFSKGISQLDYSKIESNQALFNRVIAAQYPVGSTIKPLEAIAALEEKIISPEKQINDIGYIEIKSKYNSNIFYRFGGIKPHGWVDLKKAIAVSSNVYFYAIGGGYGDQQGLGPAKIKKYLSLFGWNEKTGIDLPGEFSGFIPDPEWKKKIKNEQWWDGDTYNLSIGQSDLQITPLQVALAYCAIANGGTLYQPQIVKKIISGSGKDAVVLQEITPKIIRSGFVDPENLKIVREGMRDGVTKSYGLSGILKDLPVSVAAKTGTAEIGYKDRFNLWSAVFAPYENPEIVLVVTVEDVQALGAVTLPVAHDILKWYFNK